MDRQVYNAHQHQALFKRHKPKGFVDANFKTSLKSMLIFLQISLFHLLN